MASGNQFEAQWREGVEQVTSVFRTLPPASLERIRELAAELKGLKRSMQALVETVDAARHCSNCGGECCVAGKYHFTRADLLVYLVAGEPLFLPLFGNGLCPYLGERGCLIAAVYRPFNCITFNCELIEDQLSAPDVAGFYRMERKLRARYLELRSLFPDGSMNGALLSELPAQ